MDEVLSSRICFIGVSVLKFSVAALFLMSSVLASSAAWAGWDGKRGDLDIGSTVSSLGVGGEARYMLTDWLALRANMNGIAVQDSAAIAGTIYDFDIKLGSIGLQGDIHPFGNGFRVTLGARYGLTEVDFKSRPEECPSHDQCSLVDVVVGGDPIGGIAQGSAFTYGEGSVSFNKFVPFAGLGYEGPLYDPWGLRFAVDLGLAYQGKPKIQYRVKGEAALLATEEDIQARLDEIEDQVKFLRFFPVIGLTVSHRF
ncbi:MAG: hypothetical protein ACPG06_00610 [Alphaproteobacteria bacterium]